MKPAFLRASVISLGFAFPSALLFAQGSLAPPVGTPAPTMKTLDQIDAKLEKRTPISSLPFTIAASGSSYLTQGLTGVGTGEF